MSSILVEIEEEERIKTKNTKSILEASHEGRICDSKEKSELQDPYCKTKFMNL